MSAVLLFEFRGLDAAITKLRRRMKKLEDWHEPLTLIAEDFYEVERGWLDSEGRGSWPDLSPRYAAWKRRKVGDRPILQFTGAMYSDLTGESSGAMTVRRDRLTLRTPSSGTRWRFHAEGRGRRPVRNPISPALRIRQRTWSAILTRWANETK